MSGHYHTHCDCPSIAQSLQWNELSTQQRAAIIRAIAPPCFSGEALLASKKWDEIHSTTQRALQRVKWEDVIRGVVQ